MRLVDQHQHLKDLTFEREIKKERESEGAGGSEGWPIMRAVYSLSTSTGKVMESGKADCRPKHCSRWTDRQPQTDGRRGRAAHKKIRALCFNLARADKHSGIYQVPPCRCITWTAGRSVIY